ncbi:MAG: DUF1549 and DUF1553 domain-containing protein, partial [Bryobacteraceae bacterium]
PWPLAKADQKWSYKDEDLWAFRPLRREKNAAKGIDSFILSRLAQRGLHAAPRAGSRTLIRRLTIDLTGLPPTPEETAAFLADKSPDAYSKLVDRLLASPHYGERWGRHWLDVVRYADTNGYSNDFERPNAWRYRDYVIRSFNQDKPYDQFVREQLAGDELYRGNPEALIATGFLRAGPWEHTGMSVEAVTRQMFLDDVTNAVGVTFLGLTLGCARCHDHKFDPLPTRDYYRLQAVFATTEFARPDLPFLPSENTRGLDAGLAHMREIMKRTQAELDRNQNTIQQNVMRKHGVTRVEDLPPGVLAKARQALEGVTSEEQERNKLFNKHRELYADSVDRYLPKAFCVTSGPLDGATDGGRNMKYAKGSEYKPAVVHILPGGNVQSPSEAVTPGLVSAVARYGALPEPEVPAAVEGRRSTLANWVASPANPLTARVMVNRIWQYHFGRGIAADSNNFGKMGRKPAHPELLDWLAAYFIDHGWSVKAVHRVILLSDVYQRASAHPDMKSAREKDPGNELLAWHAPRRVDAEVLRDSILSVSGELNPEAGGPGSFPQINEDLARQPQHRMGSLAPAYRPSPTRRERNRRTVYTFQQRSLLDPLIEVFNGPSLDMSCERREASTVPTQAFSLFNGQFVHDMSLALAARVDRETRGNSARIRRAFELAYGRAPGEQEASAALAHLEKMTRYHETTPPPPPPRRGPVVHTITSELTGETAQFTQQEDPAKYEENLQPGEVSPATRALADVALALLNSNEFLYVY